jgi:tetratricopeptide (TPR) repeat protein
VLLDKKKVSYITKIGAVILALVFAATYVPIFFQPETATKKESQQDQMKRMIDTMKVAAENSPKDVNVWMQLADTYYSQNMLNEALDAYKRAASIEPKNVKTRIGVTAAYYALGQIDTATVEINEAIKLDPKFSLSYYNLGLCLTAKGELKQAVAAFEKYIKLDPKGPQVAKAKEQIAALQKAEKEASGAAFDTASTSKTKTDGTADSADQSEADILKANIQDNVDSLKTKGLMGGSDPSKKTEDPNAGGSFISIGANDGADAANPHTGVGGN